MLEPVRVAFLTEQISHHPPVSAFVAECPTRQLTLSGVDQIAAKVTSTMNVRIGPGSRNKGIFVEIGPEAENGAGECYHATHPQAVVNGMLRGNLWLSMCESTIITCSGGAGLQDGSRLRTIIDYKDESWIGKAQYAFEGIIHTYLPDEEETVAEWTKVKHVPRDRVVAELDGSWRGLVRWRKVAQLPSSDSTSRLSTASSSRGSTNEWSTLIDIGTLRPVPMVVRPLEQQLPNESRRLWNPLTTKLLAKEYSEATKVKVAIEQKQRDDAAARKAKGVEYVHSLFLSCIRKLMIL
jgi:oxysterol-binding protein-related protein 9/10/11